MTSNPPTAPFQPDPQPAIGTSLRTPREGHAGDGHSERSDGIIKSRKGKKINDLGGTTGSFVCSFCSKRFRHQCDLKYAITSLLTPPNPDQRAERVGPVCGCARLNRHNVIVECCVDAAVAPFEVGHHLDQATGLGEDVLREGGWACSRALGRDLWRRVARTLAGAGGERSGLARGGSRGHESGRSGRRGNEVSCGRTWGGMGREETQTRWPRPTAIVE